MGCGKRRGVRSICWRLGVIFSFEKKEGGASPSSTGSAETMRIREVVLREVRMKLVTPFQTSVELTDERRIILTEVVTDGAVGWGECVAGEQPFYSPETTDTAWMMMREFLWPMLKGKEIGAAGEVWGLLEHVRGHNMAKAALEAAI